MEWRSSLLFSILLLSLCIFFVTCGLPNDEPVLTAPLVTSGINDTNDYASFKNEPVTGDDYDKNYTKGYNFYYRIYTKSEYDQLGSTPKDRETRILKDASLNLTKEKQIAMITKAKDGANQFNAYYKMIMLDSINDFNSDDLSKNHIIAEDGDFEESGIHVPVEYEVEFINGYNFIVRKKSKGNKPISDPKNKDFYFYRRVYDLLGDYSYALPKRWNDFNYRDGYASQTSGKVRVDEDIAKNEIVLPSGHNDYYIAYFVSVTGFWQTKLQQIYSDVSLLGIKKVSRELTQIQ